MDTTTVTKKKTTQLAEYSREGEEMRWREPKTEIDEGRVKERRGMKGGEKGENSIKKTLYLTRREEREAGRSETMVRG